MKQRLLVIGDIHGRADALKQVLKRANVTKKDKLIVLGDVCDGGKQTKECIDILLKLNTELVAGNHDEWARQWMKKGLDFPEKNLWWHQGGIWTSYSYDHQIKNVPKKHIAYLDSAKDYIIIDNIVFVHGGFDPDRPIERQSRKFLTWDREIIDHAIKGPIPKYKHVFIGHTTTQIIVSDCTQPLTFNNLTMLDTGAGWTGRLTIMDAHTKEFWSSDEQTPER